jgi:D-3-phosphoglycerate dehydrogenase
MQHPRSTATMPRMKIAILDDYLDTTRTLACFDTLAGHDVTVFTDHLQAVAPLAERLAPFDALVLIRERTRIDASLIDRLPRLRLISLRSSYRHVDIAACARRGITVCSSLHVTTPCHAAAELTWGLTLAAMRQLPAQVASLRRGTWQTAIGRSLHGRTLGIYGYGRIGRVVAGYGRAFGMDVIAWGGEGSLTRARRDGHATAADRASFFAGCDVLSLHVRLTPDTRGTVRFVDLAAMKPDALLVNTSRAGLIAPGALVAALHAGRPGMAAVDVLDHEPVTGDAEPLLSLDNVIATPHIGYVTREEWELQFAEIFDQITAFAAGAPINVIAPEAAQGALA